MAKLSEISGETSMLAEYRLSRRATIRLLMLAGAATVLACRGKSAPAALQPALTPEDFGAKGDGETDDTVAFLALSAHLNQNDGGRVVLRRGATYVIGRQTRHQDQFLVGQPILFAENVSRFEVQMNGATLKFRDGMRFGSFHPRTGTPKTTAGPHMRRGDRADIGYAIMARNVGYFAVNGGEIDCNSRKAVVGGYWGDTGRQCVHYGVAAFSCSVVEWADLRIYDSCLDGLLYGYTGLTGRHAAKPLTVRNVVVERVARNCVSVVGTNQALFEDCRFQEAGAAPNEQLGSLRSAPAACFDLEAEEAECRNVIIRRSRLLSGPGTAAVFVADSGVSSDIVIEDCELAGTVWTSKPRTLFNRCRVKGAFGRLYGGDRNSASNSRIVGSHLSDTAPASSAPAVPNFIDLEGAGAGVRIEDTVVEIAHSRLNLRGGVLRDVTIKFATGTHRIKNRDFAILADGARFEGVEIVERIPAVGRPADAFFVTAPAAGSRTSISSPAAKLMWKSWSPAAGGHIGRFQVP